MVWRRPDAGFGDGACAAAKSVPVAARACYGGRMSITPPPRILSIAGSDSSGGAGIQADIKTITMLGGYAMTAITALTAQDTRGVHGIHTVPVPFLVQQMELVLDDLGADAVKTGMLATAEVIHAVADTLAAKAPGVPLVADPVMVAKGGHRLLDADATDADEMDGPDVDSDALHASALSVSRASASPPMACPLADGATRMTSTSGAPPKLSTRSARSRTAVG